MQAGPAAITNQLPGFSYDSAGNMLTGGYGFDAENRIATLSGQNAYVYDGDGERVRKLVPLGGTVYWGGGAGSALVESDASGTPTAEYVFAGARRIARRDISDGSVKYYFGDNLNSATAVTDATGNVLEQYDYAPYGELHWTSGSDTNHYLFTGKERDTETGLDYFGARYYANSMGRFLTPDWADKPTAVPYANYGNPQSLNLYAYVQNKPTTVADPDGHDAGDIATSGKGVTDTSGPPIADSPGRIFFLVLDLFDMPQVDRNRIPGPGSAKVQAAVLAAQGQAAQGQAQTLILTCQTTGGGPGKKDWTVDFRLSGKAPVAGVIIQTIKRTDPNGKALPDFWEGGSAWTVNKGSRTTAPNPEDKNHLVHDDTWENPPGTTVHGEARFYPGLSELPGGIPLNDETTAGRLPSTTHGPQLPTEEASQPCERTWTAPP